MEDFAGTPDGMLMQCNGMAAVLIWDGLRLEPLEAGIDAPGNAVTLAGSGTGAIVGTYYAYQRFVDDNGFPSNLSTISSSLTMTGLSGSVTAATKATPIAITSVAHGLSTGATVNVDGVGGNTAANGTWVLTVTSADIFTLNSSSGNADYNGSGTWTSGKSTITYTNVSVPTDAKVFRKQILRNTDGQTDVFYVDVDSTALSSLTFASTKDDTTLAAGEAVALLGSDGSILANRHGKPPNWKTAIAHHRDRMWLAVDMEYSVGMVQATFNSATVTGVGTAWTEAMIDRYLYVVGATKSYLIDDVDETAQTLTINSNWIHATTLFGIYAIRPAPAERRLCYFSESGAPESWPAINAVELQDDNDEITGLMPFDSFIYILERKHLHQLTYRADPSTDGSLFMSSNRGCVNNRCWLQVDERAYLLDEDGIWVFSGDQTAQAMSDPIADLFLPGGGINWRASATFHAVHYRVEGVMRWFVALSGSMLPRHALCWSYRTQRWWVEEYPQCVSASCAGYIHDVPQLYFGGLNKTIWAYGASRLDNILPTGATRRGTATSATWLSLTNSQATFATGLQNIPLVLADGRGKGQTRVIVESTLTKLTIDRPWSVMPNDTTVYQIGGIPWTYRGSWFRFSDAETEEQRRLELIFDPLTQPQTLDVRMRLDFGDAPLAWGVSRVSAQGNGVAVSKGGHELVIDMTKSTGIIQQRFADHKELWADGGRFVQIELKGAGGGETASVFELTLDGVVET